MEEKKLNDNIEFLKREISIILDNDNIPLLFKSGDILKILQKFSVKNNLMLSIYPSKTKESVFINIKNNNIDKNIFISARLTKLNEIFNKE